MALWGAIQPQSGVETDHRLVQKQEGRKGGMGRGVEGRENYSVLLLAPTLRPTGRRSQEVLRESGKYREPPPQAR